MSILKAIKNSENVAKTRGWNKTFWFFDIHATILKPNYELNNIPKEFYPFAKETLQLLSKRDDISMGIYTCSHPHEIEEYIKLFKSFDINFEMVNENNEVKTNLNGYGNYDSKPYMNVLFEDKAGFDAETDWFLVHQYITTEKVIPSKSYEVIDWRDFQLVICNEMKIDSNNFRDYHKIVGGKYKDLWHEWMNYFQSNVINDHIIPFDLSERMDIKIDWIKEDNKEWLEPFVRAVYKLTDELNIKNIKYSW